jgi:acetoin utilization protein AcuC
MDPGNAPSGTCVYIGEELERYGFPRGHPFGPDRMAAFWQEAQRQGLTGRVRILEPRTAKRKVLERFHSGPYLDRVKEISDQGKGYLDWGDTPAFPGVYQAAATVVGSVVDAVERLMTGDCRHAFVPVAGLHHARRDAAAGFCVFNDVGVALETLVGQYGLQRIAYVDIDAHHGDGVYYAFEADPRVWIADIHQDGRTLYPGTGGSAEAGKGEAMGTKLNLPQPPGANDADFIAAWEEVEAHVERARPDFIMLQCGADSLAGDPLTNLAFTDEAHSHAATRLCRLAARYAQGRLLALGGGGYNRPHMAAAWCRVLEALAEE